jgi:hypothetical protein
MQASITSNPSFRGSNGSDTKATVFYNKDGRDARWNLETQSTIIPPLGFTPPPPIPVQHALVEPILLAP